MQKSRTKIRCKPSNNNMIPIKMNLSLMKVKLRNKAMQNQLNKPLTPSNQTTNKAMTQAEKQIHSQVASLTPEQRLKMVEGVSKMVRIIQPKFKEMVEVLKEMGNQARMLFQRMGLMFRTLEENKEDRNNLLKLISLNKQVATIRLVETLDKRKSKKLLNKINKLKTINKRAPNSSKIKALMATHLMQMEATIHSLMTSNSKPSQESSMIMV